ncbi:Alpha/Beta hydrolase protein [Truncatella angustata]|uniref:Carboxypeptidase n=1 Tax=Truncatella angustata TaxID=152316 RepID=A0A9P8UVR8_9PEZI|nr:Alpha/Beta hydrolase protein [Truncatella angustata]KAH6658956.1 Alpha/Beta hydrolase protein [Truncatella angustata]KAH8203235.1 hypothetical protein TruAng_002640 [Truncatella angustata]
MAPLLRSFAALSALWQGAIGFALPRNMKGGFNASSTLDPNISISFKETHICETTPGVKGYSGYVNLPANPAEGRAYDIHTFFWFFEARKDAANAPLSLWLQGGPGSPSMTAALGENGPCRVTSDSKDTVLNEWSWNNEVNMLYIDQPVQVGFSYDRLVNGTIDEVASPFDFTPVDDLAAADLNTTHIAGTFASSDQLSTPNTTETAALAAWHFMQIWMTQFPHYTPRDNKFSIWTESYGGHYGPTFSDVFERQNTNALANSYSSSSSPVPLHLETLGIVNGCLDIKTQMPFYPVFAHNNTYGIQAYNESVYEAAAGAWPQCEALINECQAVASQRDPDSTGADSEANAACAGAYAYCFEAMWSPYLATRRNKFDITGSALSSFPPKYAAGYLNTAEVQRELGVPLNFTGYADAVDAAFSRTGDFVRGRSLAVLGELLDRGVKVALVYGDRDFQCNWLGGEAVSLAIDSSDATAGFRGSKYAPIRTNASYAGGAVRQYGNLSFSRVFGAGHEVPWYQPETAYRIFRRVMFDRDVATGTESTLPCGGDKNKKVYSTAEGDDDVFHIKNEVPPLPEPECYFWDMYETCTGEQKKIFQSGAAITKDFVLIGYVAANGTEVLF